MARDTSSGRDQTSPVNRRARQPSAQSPSGADPVLDGSAVERLRRVQRLAGQDVLAEMVRLLVRDAPVQMAAARAALEKGDAEGLRRAAHALKGSAGALGARELQALCAGIEASASSGEVSGALTLVGRLEASFRRARAALEQACRDELR